MIKNGYLDTVHKLPSRHRHYTSPQYELAEVVIPPFDAQKVYDCNGRWTWELRERNLHPTGIDIFDRYLLFLSDGIGNTTDFCRRYHVNSSHLNGMTSILTGYTCVELQQHIHMRIANQLFNFTMLSISEIIARCGIRSRTSFSRDYAAYFGISPKEIRKIQHPELMRVAEPTETI